MSKENRTEHVKVEGDLLKRLKTYMKKEDRSANYVIQKAMDSFLPKTKKSK